MFLIIIILKENAQTQTNFSHGIPIKNESQSQTSQGETRPRQSFRNDKYCNLIDGI